MVSDIPAGDGKMANSFLQCSYIPAGDGKNDNLFLQCIGVNNRCLVQNFYE
jgi:hypothetical protein